MRSSERTLIARLGFQDQDRKNPRHDLACQFVGSGDNMLRALQYIAGECTISSVTCSHEVPIVKGAGQYSSHIGFADLVALFVAETRYRCAPRPGIDEEYCDATLRHERARALVEVKITREPVGDILRQMRLYMSHFDARNETLASDEHKLLPYPRAGYGEDYDVVDRWHWSARAPRGEAEKELWALSGFSILFLDWAITRAEAELLRAHRVYPFRLGERFEAFAGATREDAEDIPQL